jgi:hypothetical protein
MRRWCCRIAAALALIVSAMSAGVSSTAMAKTYWWTCLYGLRAAPEGLFWDHFKIEFVYDDVVGHAVMIGDQGSTNVDIHIGPFGVTFWEKLKSGVTQTTTIANDGTSVHSRHTIIGREMVPTQSYGQCRKAQQ